MWKVKVWQRHHVEEGWDVRRRWVGVGEERTGKRRMGDAMQR